MPLKSKDKIISTKNAFSGALIVEMLKNVEKNKKAFYF